MIMAVTFGWLFDGSFYFFETSFKYFLNKYQHENERRRVDTFTPEAFKELMLYRWPGNIRELEHVIRSLLVASESDVISREMLPKHLLEENEQVEKSLQEKVEVVDEDQEEEIIPLDKLERDAVLKALRITEGNVEECALRLGIGRATLYRKLSRYKKLDPGNVFFE